MNDTSENSIPPVFHLTTKDKHVIRPQFQKNIDRIRELYPDHEVRVHDDTDITDFLRLRDGRYYTSVIQRMSSWIMVVDTVRYAWMATMGGVYADMDIYFKRSLRLNHEVLLLRREWTWPRDDTLTDSVHNCFFASAPGHPMWDEILEGIARNVDRPPAAASDARGPGRLFRRLLRAGSSPQPAVFDTTGPNAISRIITQNNVLRRFPEIRVEPPTAIYQAGFSRRPPGAEFVVHESAASWAA